MIRLRFGIAPHPVNCDALHKHGAGRVDGVADVGVPISMPISHPVLRMIATEACVSFELKRQEYESQVKEKSDFF